MPRNAFAGCLAASVGSLAFVWLAVHAYQEWWVRGAEREVRAAADALAGGVVVPGLELESYSDAAALASAFGSGFRVVGFDNIGLGFRAYEVTARVANGDLYNFDAIYLDGAWHLSCCVERSRSELP